MEDNLNDVEGQVGTLKLNLDGSVVSSSGDLAEDPDLPNIIVSLLQDVNAIVKNSGKESPFKRLTVAFSQSSFVVTIANGKIYVVKKK